MALVPCPECQKEVSTRAFACPQCAFPFPGKPSSAEGQAGATLHPCPDCGCLVSRKAQSCPHCGVVLLKGEQELIAKNGNVVEETWLCTHCGTPYTRKVRQEQELMPDCPTVHSARLKNSVEDPLGQDSGHLKLPSNLASPRRRSQLWQDSSLSPQIDQGIVSPRYPRSRKKSLIVGLIIVVLVAASIALGTLWQLQGINPLEALVSWRL